MELKKKLKDIYFGKPSEKIYKEYDCWIGIILGDTIDIPLTRLLAKFKIIHPNYITILSSFFAFSAAYFFIQGDLILGAILYWINFVLDGTDGKLARLTNKTSKIGAKLDYYLDIINHFAMYFGLWWSLYYLQGQWLIGASIISAHYFIMIFGFLFITNKEYKTVFPRVNSYYSSFEEAVGTFLFAPLFGIVEILLPTLILLQFINYIILFIKQKQRPNIIDGIKNMLGKNI